MKINKDLKDATRIFLEAEVKEDTLLAIRGIGSKPSPIFGRSTRFQTVQGTTMLLLELRLGKNGYGLVRPASKEDIE